MEPWKKMILLTVCIIFMLPLTACGGNKSNSNTALPGVPADRQYTFWLRVGDEHYTDYAENPGVEYLKTLSYGTDANGNPKKIDMSFTIPVPGSEADNFNTLIATGQYMDVMDLSAYSGTALDLYNNGIAIDITDYVKKYMPNYTAFLDAHPDLKATATNVIDGEKRYIQLISYLDSVGYMWGGYQYRRDWIVKYGVNPVDGSAFSGAYTAFNPDGTPNPDSWVDNVVFPSGGSDPVYISDWEWMLGIFKTAIKALNISDGYPMSLYYPGYIETGDLVCAFGGGDATWYKNADNQIVYGATSDDFRTYLQAMNTWYQNGWIDTAFPEHTSDQFFSIDNTKIFSGKVGLWYGLLSSLGGRLAKSDDPYLNGFVSYTAAQPINDIYGSDAQKNKTPFAMYQQGQEGVKFIITTAAKDKDLEILFTFLDYMYSKEGAVIRTFGLSKEQYDVTHNAFMTENGFTEGAYKVVVDPDGVTRYQVYQDILDRGLENAVKPGRLFAMDLNSLKSKSGYLKGYQSSLDRWTQYTNTGWLSGSFTGQLSADDSKTYTKVNTNVVEFLTKNVPSFIKGTKNPFSDEDWNAFVNALNKYGPDKVTVIFQELADRMYAK
jgi:hypothetical protein